MSFINELLSKSRNFYREKLNKKKLISSSKVSNKNISLNGKKLNLKFIKIKNNIEKDKFLKCSNFDDYHLCYLVTWTKKFSTRDFIQYVDLVLCNLEWKVLKLYKSLPINVLLNFEQNSHIFIMPHNSIEYNEINIGDYLRPF